MENRPKGSVYKGISLCIKLLIVAASCWYIYTKVFHRHYLDGFTGILFSSFTGTGILLFVAALLLMPVNWGIESVKWRKLILPLHPITPADAFKAVLAGVAVSTVTPNRAGEFAGRVFFLGTGEKLRATWLTFAGSAMQLSVTLLGGAFSFLVFSAAGMAAEIPAEETLMIRLVGLIAVCCVVLAALFLVLFPYLIRGAASSKSRFVSTLDVLNRIGKRKLFGIFLLSCLRYLVFFFQFSLLLSLFETDVRFMDQVILIPLTFFAVSVIPTVALSELFVRGSAALLLFSPVAAEPAAVFAASLALWFINVALPALAGCFFVFRLKFFREE